MPRARIEGEDGKTSEWKNKSLRAYQRRTKAADALIAGAYLSGTNTRRVRRALAAVFAGAVGKDVVSRTWRKVKGDWGAWNARSLKDEPIVRLILDGIHASKATRAALAERRHWLTPEWLAKYAPELNDIERDWKTLKAHHLAHKTFKNRDDLKTTIDADIQAINSTRKSQPLANQRISA